MVYPVGPAAGRVPSLHFTLRVQGMRKAAFDAQKMGAWKAALKTALPGAPAGHALQACAAGQAALIEAEGEA